MLADERRRLIHRHLCATGSVRTPELANMLGVSSMTVWRDLGTMERAGALRRVHGGAVLREEAGAAEPQFAAKTVRAAEEKRAIAAQLAATLLRSGLTIAVEGGTTAVAVMPHLQPEAGITVLTNSAEVVRQVPPGVSVYCSGGLFRPVSQTFVGPQAVQFFEQHRADLALISATGVDEAQGLMDPNPLEAEVKRALCRCAEQIVLLVDSSKWNQRSVVSVLPLAEVDVVITDAPPPQAFRTKLRAAGARLEVVRKLRRSA